MTRYLTYTTFLLVSVFFIWSCNDGMTYADELKAEQNLIDNFIKRQQIQVVTIMPTEFPWPEKVYYKDKTGFYFRLTHRGDYQNDSIEVGDQIVTKYEQYTLGVPADTISTVSTIQLPHPNEFFYRDYSTGCPAWHDAVGYMKYNNAEAQLIVPSQIGFPEFIKPATPVGYDVKIRVRNY